MVPLRAALATMAQYGYAFVLDDAQIAAMDARVRRVHSEKQLGCCVELFVDPIRYIQETAGMHLLDRAELTCDVVAVVEWAAVHVARAGAHVARRLIAEWPEYMDVDAEVASLTASGSDTYDVAAVWAYARDRATPADAVVVADSSASSMPHSDNVAGGSRRSRSPTTRVLDRALARPRQPERERERPVRTIVVDTGTAFPSVIASNGRLSWPGDVVMETSPDADGGLHLRLGRGTEAGPRAMHGELPMNIEEIVVRSGHVKIAPACTRETLRVTMAGDDAKLDLRLTRACKARVLRLDLDARSEVLVERDDDASPPNLDARYAAAAAVDCGPCVFATENWSPKATGYVTSYSNSVRHAGYTTHAIGECDTEHAPLPANTTRVLGAGTVMVTSFDANTLMHAMQLAQQSLRK